MRVHNHSHHREASAECGLVRDEWNRAVFVPIESSGKQCLESIHGLEPVGSTPQQFAAYIRFEIEKWGKVVREAGIKLE